MRDTRRVGGQLLLSYAYVGVMALITLFVVPWYARSLGPRAWGYVALCLTLQGLLFSFDALLGPIMLRDLARAAERGALPATYRRFLRGYAVPAIAAFAMGQAAIGFLSIDRDLALALRLCLVQFLFQFCNNAAVGWWNAQGRQGEASVRLALFALLKNAAALLALGTLGTSAVNYMWPFALFSVVELVANQIAVRREQKSLAGEQAAIGEWRDAGGYAIGAVLGLLAAQSDRLFLSLALPPAEYGVYVLVSGLMLSFFSLQMPIQRAFLPRLAVAASPREVLRAMRIVTTVLIILPALALAMFPEFVLQLWLRNPIVAHEAASTFRVLMLALAISAWCAPTSLLLLHRHRNGLIGMLNATIFVVQVTLMVVLTARLGMLAGAIAWLGGAVVQLCMSVVTEGHKRRSA